LTQEVEEVVPCPTCGLNPNREQIIRDAVREMLFPEIEKLVQARIQKQRIDSIEKELAEINEKNSRDSEIDRAVKKMFPTHNESAYLFGD
jgi:ribosomal protein L13